MTDDELDAALADDEPTRPGTIRRALGGQTVTECIATIPRGVQCNIEIPAVVAAQIRREAGSLTDWVRQRIIEATHELGIDTTGTYWDDQ